MVCVISDTWVGKGLIVITMPMPPGQTVSICGLYMYIWMVKADGLVGRPASHKAKSWCAPHTLAHTHTHTTYIHTYIHILTYTHNHTLTHTHHTPYIHIYTQPHQVMREQERFLLSYKVGLGA